MTKTNIEKTGRVWECQGVAIYETGRRDMHAGFLQAGIFQIQTVDTCIRDCGQVAQDSSRSATNLQDQAGILQTGSLVQVTAQRTCPASLLGKTGVPVDLRLHANL